MSAIAYTAIGNTMPYITVFNKQVNKGFNVIYFSSRSLYMYKVSCLIRLRRIRHVALMFCYCT